MIRLRGEAGCEAGDGDDAAAAWGGTFVLPSLCIEARGLSAEDEEEEDVALRQRTQPHGALRLALT